MAIDLKQKIEELYKKIRDDKELQQSFLKEPVSALEKLLGVDLPDDQINAVADGIKAKLAADKLSGAAGALGGLFK